MAGKEPVAKFKKVFFVIYNISSSNFFVFLSFFFFSCILYCSLVITQTTRFLFVGFRIQVQTTMVWMFQTLLCWDNGLTSSPRSDFDLFVVACCLLIVVCHEVRPDDYNNLLVSRWEIPHE